MIRKIFYYLCIGLMVAAVAGCGLFQTNSSKKIAVSFGVGPATRWAKEKVYMEQRAKELGLDATIVLDSKGSAEDQVAECKRLVDSGISVLIIMPKDPVKLIPAVEYAKSKKVKVISYARFIPSKDVNLFIGYDNYRIGQSLGLYTIEMIQNGNFIILKGDKSDSNAHELYKGVIQQIQPMMNNGVKVILDDYVAGWSPETAKPMIKKALLANDKQVAAILAPNDKIAGAAVAVIKELGIKNKVVVTGMDAELPAVKRIIAGDQSMTVHLDLKELAYTAIDEAKNAVFGEKFIVNAEFEGAKNIKIPSYLLSGKVITKETIGKYLINPDVYTKEQIYN